MRWLICCFLMLPGCLPETATLTDPCASDCNDSANVGDACAEASDCAKGDACFLEFPGGYCQGFCAADDGQGDACGNDDSGVCVETDGEAAPACIGQCDAADPESCGRDTSACYSLEGEDVGVCYQRCASAGSCGSSMACDGQGLCRAAVSSCDALTGAGCREGNHCYLSANGLPFCGLAGQAGAGQACAVVAGCVANHWCVQGACRKLCDIEDFSACGGVPSLCTPVVSGTRVGVCVQ
jgi:hypothetical protein